MSTEKDDFLKKLQATFKVEAAEHLRAIATGLLELEQTPAPEPQRRIVETVFRAAHSLKGAARAVDFAEIESLCQSLEDVFAAWKRQESVPSPATLDTLHRTLDAIAAAMSTPEATRGAPVSAPRPSFDPPIRHPEAAASENVVPSAPVVEQKTLISEQTVRIGVSRLEAQLLEAEEMLTVKLTAGQRVQDLRELAHGFEAWRTDCAAVETQARAFHQAIDPGLAKLLLFLDQNLDHLKSLEGKVAALTRTAEQDRHVIGKLVDDLLEDSKKLLLLPFDTISASFPKLVRDLCRDQGKDASLVIRGEEVAIDKRILEEMKDPLVHLLRNCVDHGIEPPSERARRDKPSRGTITLTVTQVNGNKVQLLIADDGAGIDTGKVKESAVRHGLISAEEATRLDEPAAQALIFQSEVSASPIITKLSGRGLGLAIVRENAERLGGEVSVESRSGLGSAFRIVVPATRATFRSILVEAAGRLLVVPTAQVERAARARPEDIQTVEGRETISIDGRAVALVQLADALELPPAERKNTPAAGAPVIVLGSGDQRVAFAVDAVLDEQEVLVKPLVKPLSRVRNIAGATVLGSGQVAPILNVADLLKSARKIAGVRARLAAGAAPMHTETRTILPATT